MTPLAQFSAGLLGKLRLSRRANNAGEFAELEERLGYVFRDETLLRTSLTHPSVKAVEPKARDYQRLEFLGDAVLGLVFAETLYAATDDAAEGLLTDARSRLARGSHLATVGRKLELGRHLRLASGGDAERIRDTDTAHEDALEAVFGAVFLDGGLDAARTLAHRLFADELKADSTRVAQSRSPKNRLQELVQRDGAVHDGQRIEYRVTGEEGPPHRKVFTVEVWVDGTRRGGGIGSSKRAASEAAAEDALARYSE